MEVVIFISAALTGEEDKAKEMISKDFNAIFIGLETPLIFSMMFLENSKTSDLLRNDFMKSQPF